MTKFKSRISTKLTLTLSIIIFLSFLFVVLINTVFLPRYYLYKMENKIDTVSQKLKTGSITEQAEQLEEEYQVTILKLDMQNISIDDLNETIRTALTRKGIALNRFWITEETLKQLAQQPTSIQKRYNQGKQKSSFLVNLQLVDQHLYLVGISMVDFSETATIINTFTFISLGFILIIVLILVYFSTKKITQPLTELKEVAEKIAQFTFVQATQLPPNEIGELALSINKMSHDLEHYQTSLLTKNQQLKQFTADLTHELKTPIAIIKAYGNGIKDELDDGTYLETILTQADLLTTITTKMLDYAKLEQQDLHLESFSIIELLHQRINLLQPVFKEQNSHLIIQGEAELKHSTIIGDKLLLAQVFDNLLTNALKYATIPELTLKWQETATTLKLMIRNPTTLTADFSTDKLWEAFYVHEKSRNKNLSGTGLGLAIVKTIMEQHDFNIDSKIVNQEIEFSLEFKKA